mmetsp:Transcript_6053/g.11346  ORF Transcript_6053/g.11346 Transcript_6053/m.11346 type:complete len:499 (+) Transcript_6053:91-1587(+)
MHTVDAKSCHSDIHRAWDHPGSLLLWTPMRKSGKSGERQTEYTKCASPRAMIALFARHKNEGGAWRVSAKADFIFDLKRGHVSVEVAFKPQPLVDAEPTPKTLVCGGSRTPIEVPTPKTASAQIVAEARLVSRLTSCSAHSTPKPLFYPLFKSPGDENTAARKFLQSMQQQQKEEQPLPAEGMPAMKADSRPLHSCSSPTRAETRDVQGLLGHFEEEESFPRESHDPARSEEGKEEVEDEKEKQLKQCLQKNPKTKQEGGTVGALCVASQRKEGPAWNPVAAFAGLAAATTAAAEASVAGLLAVASMPVDNIGQEEVEDNDEGLTQLSNDHDDNEDFKDGDGGGGGDDAETHMHQSTSTAPVFLLRTQRSSPAAPAPSSVALRAPLSPGYEYDSSWLLKAAHANAACVGVTEATTERNQASSSSPSSSSFVSPASPVSLSNFSSPAKRRFSFRDMLFHPRSDQDEKRKGCASPKANKRAKVLFEGDSRGPRTVPRLLS